MAPKKVRWPRITRDTILFVAGLAGTFREAVFEEGERPYFLMLFAGMMGLPVFLRKDERREEDRPSPGPGPPPPPVPPTTGWTPPPTGFRPPGSDLFSRILRRGSAPGDVGQG